MKKTVLISFLILAFILASCAGGNTPTASQPVENTTTGQATEASLSYTNDIQPIFTQNCVNCHGVSGGLALDSYDHVMKGGISGAVVIAGDSEGSLLVKRITGAVLPRMPKGKSLTQDQIDLIQRWIGEGALNN